MERRHDILALTGREIRVAPNRTVFLIFDSNLTSTETVERVRESFYVRGAVDVHVGNKPKPGSGLELKTNRGDNVLVWTVKMQNSTVSFIPKEQLEYIKN